MQRRERVLGIFLGLALSMCAAVQQVAAQPRGLPGEPPEEEEYIGPVFDPAAPKDDIFDNFTVPGFGDSFGGGVGPSLGGKDVVLGVPYDVGQLTPPNLPQPVFDEPDRIPVIAETGPTSCSAALLNYYNIQNSSVLYSRRNAEAMFDACYAARQPAPARLTELVDRSVIIFHSSSERSGGHCTGFLLDSDTVITAAHCFDVVSASATQEIAMTENCASFSVRLGRDLIAAGNTAEQLRASFGTIPSISIASLRLVNDPAQEERCGTLRVARADLARDLVFAKLELPATMPNGAPLAPIEIGADAGAIAPSALLFVIGRRPHTFGASGYALVALRENTCRLLFDPRSENSVIVHHCLTLPGMSGGPIFAELDNGSLGMIGVHQVALAQSRDQTQCNEPFRGAATIPRCTSEPINPSFMNAGHAVSNIKGETR